MNKVSNAIKIASMANKVLFFIEKQENEDIYFYKYKNMNGYEFIISVMDRLVLYDWKWYIAVIFIVILVWVLKIIFW